MTQSPWSSATRAARVDSDARSLPAPGSLNSWHHSSSAGRMRGSQRARCSGVPCASSVGPTRLMPIRPTSSGARARASSSVTMKCSTAPAPRPPYSSGHGTPTHRPPASSACHSRPNATSSARLAKRGGKPLPYSHGRCSRSQARTSSRSRASSAVGARSNGAVSRGRRWGRTPARWDRCRSAAGGRSSSAAPRSSPSSARSSRGAAPSRTARGTSRWGSPSRGR